MGAGSSRPGYQVGLTKQEDARLQRRFMRAARTSDRADIPSLLLENDLHTVFAQRALQLFDNDRDGCLSLDEFKNAVDLLGNLNTEEEQAQFAFRMFDLDKSEQINAEELKSILSLMGEQTSATGELDQVVQALMVSYDANGDGQLSLDEFKQLLTDSLAVQTEASA